MLSTFLSSLQLQMDYYQNVYLHITEVLHYYTSVLLHTYNMFFLIFTYFNEYYFLLFILFLSTRRKIVCSFVCVCICDPSTANATIPFSPSAS